MSYSPSDQPTNSWAALPIAARCRIVGSAAAQIVLQTQRLVDACQSEQRTDRVETVTGELLPLCAAIKWIGRRGAKALSPRKLGSAGRPIWLFGVSSVVQRVPLGDVLILGAWNYSILLTGVQTAQALAAGNRVLLKPAPGSEAANQIIAECFWAAGVPAEQLVVLDSSVQVASAAIQQGVDLIVLTGGAVTGQKVLKAAAENISAAVMELSGCDAVLALPGCDTSRLAACIRFGLAFNSGATCIGPRRLLVDRSLRDDAVAAIKESLLDASPMQVHPSARVEVGNLIRSAIRQGAVDVLNRFDSDDYDATGKLAPMLLDNVHRDSDIVSSDLFAPIISVVEVENTLDAIQLINECPFRLAASIFGPPAAATAIAQQLAVGSVAINDLIVPTADPRVPFGGRGKSGFGVTRGEEGLVAMTAPRVISRRRGSFLIHLRPRQPSDEELLTGLLQFLYSKGIGSKWRGLIRLIKSQR